MASLAQKDVTQATVVRKLSAYARQNRTKKALAELDNICRTLYILDTSTTSCCARACRRP